jgi:organic radical activating enzyme
MSKGRINEIFDSVQGEGIYLGERQIFVRFYGCNLSCSFCDTKLDRFTDYDPQELLKEIMLHGGPEDFHSVSFTGGEPLLQKDFLKEAMMLVREKGYRVYLETNGTLPGELADVIECVDVVAMDIKLPSSTDMGALWGMHKRFLEIAARKEVFIKVIICESTTDDEVRRAIELVREITPGAMVVLQPNSFEPMINHEGRLEHFRLLCSEHNITCCVIPQMHTIAGVK